MVCDNSLRMKHLCSAITYGGGWVWEWSPSYILVILDDYFSFMSQILQLVYSWCRQTVTYKTWPLGLKWQQGAHFLSFDEYYQLCRNWMTRSVAVCWLRLGRFNGSVERKKKCLSENTCFLLKTEHYSSV